MSDTTVRWTGTQEVKANMTAYGNQVIQAVEQVATYYAGVMETYAKQNAPWTDRTGNARQSLYAFTERLGNDAVKLYLSHGIEYGLWLEIRWAGRYAIIWPTIERHLPQIANMLQEIFR